MLATRAENVVKLRSLKKLSIGGRVHAFPKVQLYDLKRPTASAESGMQHTPQESDRTASRPRTVAALSGKDAFL